MKFNCLKCGRVAIRPYCSWTCQGNGVALTTNNFNENPKAEPPKMKYKYKPKSDKLKIRSCACGKTLGYDDHKYCSDHCREQVCQANAWRGVKK